MKLLTSEIVTLFADSLLGSYLKDLEEAYYKSQDKMRDELKDLEEGGIFSTLGIKNFLEADYFAWYLDEWNAEIAQSIFEVVKKLLDYEPATVELNPERVKDLFKRLYQNLVSRDVRHKLGEYYTPDWLAELLLDEVGYDGNPDKRVLDPACGSGTFLVLTIKRIKEYADERFLDKRELIKKIIDNVKGIDLNPLAVLASKANYLIALSDLLRYRPKEGIEIPIYLADSVSIERGRKWETLTKEHVDLRLYTSEGEFWVPIDIIEKNILDKVLYYINQYVQAQYSRTEFEKVLIAQLKRENIYLSGSVISSIGRLFDKITKLEKYGKNKIWTALLKNSFAPMLIGKFDYVIGNPPWINWESLPELYRNREEVKDLWNRYGLLEKTKGMGLGKVKRDFAMLFVARCFSTYVKDDDGTLSFLIPFTAYKTQAGAGFRKWLANQANVTKIHDLVELYPFEGAINRTSLIVIGKGKTKFPIHCVMWHNPKSRGIDQEAELEEVKKTTKQFNMIFAPINKGKFETPWMIIGEKAYAAVQKVMKPSEYRAYAGVYTGLNSAYWIKIHSKQNDEVLISNLSEIGKKSVREIKTITEKDLIYPLVRGRNVKKWYFSPSLHIIVPHDPKTGKPIMETDLKIQYPKAYSYFLKIKKDLETRQIHKLWGKGQPFYSLYDIGDYSFAPYKVCWKVVAGKISGKGEFSTAVVESVKDSFLGYRTAITDIKLIIIPFKNKDEAHYVSAILNSSFAYVVVASYVIETGISAHVLENLSILKFSPENKLHLKLSDISKKAHDLAKKYYEQDDLAVQDELKKVEGEIDKTVAELYGISKEELEEIKKTLRILKEGEVEEEETEEEEIVLPKAKDIELKVEPLFIQENEVKELQAYITNNSNKIVEKLKVEIYLENKLLTSQQIKKIDSNSSTNFGFKIHKLESGEHELKLIVDIDGSKIEEKRKLFVGTEKKMKKVKRDLDEEIERILK